VGEAYPRLLDRAAPGALEGATLAPGRLRVFSARPGFFRRAYGHGWALVGDAGYFKDPITSHGLTDALRDAELLARAIISATCGEACEEDALAGYQRTRDCLSARLLAITDAIASFSWDLDRIPTLLLELSDSMSDEVRLIRDLEPLRGMAPVR
jgi:flavin-dependent dehydrogenase